jgi:arylsulfatase A-like enzyme
MSRWRVFATSIALALGSSQLSCERADSVSEPPNVIIYLIDTLRADHLGVYGYPRDTSPTIDALAEESILFTDAQAQSSWTRASVGSLFTGLFPSRHGAVTRANRLRVDVPTLAELLREQGYATAAVIANPNVLRIFGFDRGFDVFSDVVQLHGSSRGDAVNAEVFAILDGLAGSRFFLYVHVLDPHSPYEAPAPFDKKFVPRAETKLPGVASAIAKIPRSIADYDGEIAYADHQLALLLERLRKSGLLDETIFVLLSDHGEEFMDHGGMTHGKTLFGEQLRVPMLMRLPGRLHAGRVVSAPVRVLDVLPSLADLLGIPVPDALDARSFMPMVRGESEADGRPLFAELDLDKHLVQSLRVGDEKIIVRRSPRKRASTKLFDLAADPRERRDLASAAPGATRRLEAELQALASSLSNGIFVELHGSTKDRGIYSASLLLSTEDGRFDHVTALLHETGDRVVVAPGGRRIKLEVSLENYPNPTRFKPYTIRDSDGIRFRLVPPDARWTIEVAEDGVALEEFSFRIGAENGTAPLALPLALPNSAPAIRVHQVGIPDLRRAPRPYVHLYVMEPASQPVEIDAELDERLRALGYLGEDAEPAADE